MSGTSTSTPTAVCLMAVPGDAEMLCGSTLIRLKDLGWRLHIATLTAGDCGSGQLNPAETAEKRRVEARASATQLGAVFHDFGEPEGYVAYERALVRRVVDHLRSLAPVLVFTHAPRDASVDREQTSLIARNACLMLPQPNASSVPVAPGARVPHLYFCDPPAAREPAGGIVQPTAVVRTTKQHDRRMELVARHDEGLAALARRHGLESVTEHLNLHAIDRGRLAGAVYAEAFVQYRGPGFPQDDLLRDVMT